MSCLCTPRMPRAGAAAAHPDAAQGRGRRPAGPRPAGEGGALRCALCIALCCAAALRCAGAVQVLCGAVRCMALGCCRVGCCRANRCAAQLAAVQLACTQSRYCRCAAVAAASPLLHAVAVPHGCKQRLSLPLSRACVSCTLAWPCRRSTPPPSPSSRPSLRRQSSCEWVGAGNMAYLCVPDATKITAPGALAWAAAAASRPRRGSARDGSSV